MLHQPPPPIKKQKITFLNRSGQQLAALLERPVFEPLAYALFAHCFTCSKDIAAAARISRALAAEGFGVVRFDFTGLGHSEGEFANTNFTSNVQDLITAADFLRREHEAPALLIGHSLGGAAVLAAAADIAETRAVVTIGAPSDPAHVSHLFESSRAEIESRGSAVVNLAGRSFEIQKQFLEDIAAQNLEGRIRGMRKALLVLHSPVDDIVTIENASSIFQAARHPKSFISLDRADHLLTRREDSQYVATTIAAWAGRYVLTAGPHVDAQPALATGEVLVHELDGKFAQQVYTDKHRLYADEPEAYGGTELGPSPYEYLLAGLGTCTTMTVRMYASRKNIPLDHVSVSLKHEKIHTKDCETCETKEGRIDHIERELEFVGDIEPDQRAALMAIAEKCPVHRTLHAEVDIVTRMK